MSDQLGLILQGSENLTRQQIQGATAFVEHNSTFPCVHLMCKIESEKMLPVKHDFDHYAFLFGVNIKTNHAENGRISDSFKEGYLQQHKK